MIEPMPRVVLSAGGRYDRLRSRQHARQRRRSSRTDFSAFSPKLSATFRLVDAGVSRIGRRSTSTARTRTPSCRRARPSSLIPADVPLNLQPEDIDNYEGGAARPALMQDRLALEATYFWMKHTGVVLEHAPGCRSSSRPTPANSSTGESRPALSFAVTPKLSAYLNASFYRNRFGDFVIESEDGDEVLTGNRLPIAPDHVVNWGASIHARSDFDVTFDVKHVGDVVVDRDNAFLLDAYTLMDAAATYRRGMLRFTLSAHNLFNNRSYSEGDLELASPGAPRQILFTTSVSFR